VVAKVPTSSKQRRNVKNSFNGLLTNLVNVNDEAMSMAYMQARQMANQFKVETDLPAEKTEDYIETPITT